MAGTRQALSVLVTVNDREVLEISKVSGKVTPYNVINQNFFLSYNVLKISVT